MKTIIAILMITAFILESLQAQGFFKTRGQDIVDGQDNPVLLRGVGLGGWIFQEGYMVGISLDVPGGAGHTNIRNAIVDLVGEENTQEYYRRYEANFFNEGDMLQLAEWGFDHIRLPFGYKTFYDRESGEFREEGFELIDNVLAWSERADMNLVLDMHGAPGAQSHSDISDSDGTPRFWTEHQSNKPIAIAIWQEIARRYATEERIIGYDILNEPVLPSGWSNSILRDYYEEVTDSIRQIDNNHILFFEGNNYANNFDLLTPPWDDNMVYSFHKYWNGTTTSSISWVLNIRKQYNVPLWMGEAGENSNPWFYESARMLEANNVGWCWWTHKKIENITCPYSAIKSDDYRVLTDYWSNPALPKPDAEFAKNTLFQMAENLESANCDLRPGSVKALLNSLYSIENVPFTQHVIPGIINAVDYDIGYQDIAYHDLDYRVINFHNGERDIWNRGWLYRNDGVDIERSTDSEGFAYNVGWIENDEWIKYTVEVQESGLYRMDIRVAANVTGGQLQLSFDGHPAGGVLNISNTGGWQNWVTKTTEAFNLSQGTHEMRLSFPRGGFNINRMNFRLVATAIDDDPGQLPVQYELAQNYPNPFNPVTMIRYTLPKSTPVKLEVFNVHGEIVAVPVDQRQASGTYSVAFDGALLGSGQYFYRLTTKDFSQTRKMMLIK